MTFLIAVPDAQTHQPHMVDRHVGNRVRLQRRTLGMSQSVLGEKVGVTFQQVQKYERGANRISASKLYEISQVLEAPISYFFDGLPAPNSAGGGPLQHAVEILLASADGAEIATAFPRIRSDSVRRVLVKLIRSLGEAD